MNMKNLLWILMAFAALTGCKKDKKGTAATLNTIAATAITANTASVGGSISSDGGAPVSKRGVCWATHAGPTYGDSITTDGSGSGNFNSSLKGLYANTVYYVRAYAINAMATAYGNEITFTTAKGTPAVVTSPITGSAPLTATSGGTVVSDGGAAVTERGVVYSKTSNPTIADTKVIAATPGTGEFTGILTPLLSETVYYVRAYATNSYGTSYGNEISFTASSSDTFADIDGNIYSYVTIGGKKWMTSNLKVTKYRNGEAITNGFATTGFDWYTTTVGAYTFPNGDAANNEIYGKLYNIFAVNEPRNIAPEGWHVATDDDWKALEIAQGMSSTDADIFGDRGTISEKLLEGGTSGLNLQNTGILFHLTGGFYYFGEQAYYWSGTPAAAEANITNWYRGLKPGTPTISRQIAAYGMAVRCVKD
ncbi:MAG: hypothetical protein EOP51_21640 [Sphingobacteriales bacterium]|nr:MAG: hypothetical protein EOP51_21640 [Sphingobacteriales bacterium]